MIERVVCLCVRHIELYFMYLILDYPFFLSNHVPKIEVSIFLNKPISDMNSENSDDTAERHIGQAHSSITLSIEHVLKLRLIRDIMCRK